MPLIGGPLTRRGPGLLGMAARTAVVAGTASAVGGSVRRRQAERYAERETDEETRARYEAGAASPAATAAANDDLLDRLERLARLHESGALTDEEFKQQKTELLAE